MLSFLFIRKLPCSKPFYSTLNYTSTANIQEVMNFYNLGNKTFETDFRFNPCALKMTVKLSKIGLDSVVLQYFIELKAALHENRESGHY